MSHRPLVAALGGIVLAILLLGAAGCGDGAIPSGSRQSGKPGVRLIGYQPPPQQAPSALVPQPPPSPLQLYASVTATATEHRIFESLDGRSFVDIGITPAETLSDGVRFQVPDSGGVAHYYVTARIGDRVARSNRVTARGVAQQGAPGILEPRAGAVGVSRKPTFRWDPIAGADGYLLLVVGGYAIETRSSSWTVERAGPLFYQRSGGGQLPARTKHFTYVFALDATGWATVMSPAVSFDTGS